MPIIEACYMECMKSKQQFGKWFVVAMELPICICVRKMYIILLFSLHFDCLATIINYPFECQINMKALITPPATTAAAATAFDRIWKRRRNRKKASMSWWMCIYWIVMKILYSTHLILRAFNSLATTQCEIACRRTW